MEIFAPAKASKCDILLGSAKKGKFQQYVFKTDKGKPVQVYTRYDRNGEIKDVITDYSRDNGVLNITRRTISNGENTNEYVSILPQQTATGEIVFSKSFMNSTKDGEKGGLELLRKG